MIFCGSVTLCIYRCVCIAEDYANVPLDAGNIDPAWQDYIKKQFAKVSNDVFALACMQDPPEILFSPPDFSGNPDEAVTREEILEAAQKLKEWKRYVTQHSDIGIFTIAYMHDDWNMYAKYYVKVLLWLVLVD